MDPKKVVAITNWGASENLHGVRAFLGFVNFYQRFIKGYTNILAPIVALTCKDDKFFWRGECNKACQCLKDCFTSVPVLSHFDPDKYIIVETDASD
jgi:hypothetical protein